METKQIRILLVEDNFKDMMFPLESMMAVKSEWCVITHVERLEDAVLRIKEEKWDVILLDLVLPDSMGLTTLEKIRNAAPDLPIVVLTGLDNSKFGIQALELGANAFLSKRNVNAVELVRAVMKVIRQRNEELAACV